MLATQAGDVELRIPKLRKGSFFPVILEPRRRIDQALYTADKLNGRADLYRTLVRASRDLGGLIGGGAYAVAQSQNAESRLRHTSVIGVPGAGESLQELARLCDRTDARIAAHVERGLTEKLYLVAANSPGLMEEPIRGIRRLQQRWLPADSRDQIPLLSLIREQVRPQPSA